MEEEIKSEFRKAGFDLDEEEEILNKCVTFCINYTLSPSDLVSSWEVYYLNRVGCCTVDILKQLSGEEISRSAADGKPVDRMSRLANHILSQKSFYPLYPPAKSVPLDFSLAPEALQLSSGPDILILPCDIKYFVKVLNAVNPGRLAKGEGRQN